MEQLSTSVIACFERWRRRRGMTYHIIDRQRSHRPLDSQARPHRGDDVGHDGAVVLHQLARLSVLPSTVRSSCVRRAPLRWAMKGMSSTEGFTRRHVGLHLQSLVDQLVHPRRLAFEIALLNPQRRNSLRVVAVLFQERIEAVVECCRVISLSTAGLAAQAVHRVAGWVSRTRWHRPARSVGSSAHSTILFDPCRRSGPSPRAPDRRRRRPAAAAAQQDHVHAHLFSDIRLRP